ncbi:endo-1,4-beta-xylanase [Cellulomonas sp. 179-A 9B4 NHS]|uniref:endo-1,4-beta-xylanase n=1 Tax=Cellulomonas sp. 179-A 9B4 NHS TaxID=3142379 RepID=UPI0039A3CA7C
MRRTRRPRKGLESIGIGAVVLGLVAAPLIGTQALAAGTEPVVVLEADFDDGTLGDLQQSGSPTFGYVDEGTGKALSITNRANSWDSVASAAGVMEAGVEYTLSARVRLVDDVAGATARFTMFDGKEAYDWLSNTPVTASGWTTIEGTWTLPATADPAAAKFTFEAGAGSTHVSVLLDDVLVTRPAAEPTVTEVLSATFDDGTLGPLQQSGSPTFGYVDEGTGKALSITGRANSWDSVASAAGVMEAGVEYTLSARVRLVDDVAGATARFTMFDGKEAYDWLSNTPVTASGWTTIEGTWTLPATADPAAAKFTFEAGAGSTHVSVLLDDVLVTRPGAGGGEQPEPVVPGGALNPTTTPVTAARGTGDVAALTFDDGPNGADTTRLLDFLAENDLPATFCVIGQNIQAPGGADLLKRIVREGHTLCNHSTGYADMGSWSADRVRADLVENLDIIRTALGDPQAQVPYFRAPNGSWGSTRPVAVELGMQPLGVVNTIADWETQDEATLTANLRRSMKPGEVVLVHDGGGARAGSVAATRTVVTERLAEGWTFTLPAGGAPENPAGGTVVSDFEDGTLQGWSPRDDGNGAPTVEVVEPGHDSDHAARVSGRVSQGQGMQYPVAGVLVPGTTYDLDAWIRFDGTPGDMTLSAHTRTGETDGYSNLVQITGVTGEWTHVTGRFAVPAGVQEIYFETEWASGEAGNTSTFLVDDVAITPTPPGTVQDLPPLQGTVDFPLGVAIDSRETTGSAAQLTELHFGQLTPENHMKPEAWYTGRTFTPHPEADAIMRYAQENDLRVYGHVLAWHSQTPAWFFQDDAGNPLPADEAGKQVLRDRLRTHVFDIAEYLASEYGLFGSDTNPLVAWDVVNEVISDGSEFADGMRRSEWYRILGEEFVDLTFAYAEEAFNDEYAAPGTDRPVTLFINDYNTEQAGKQQRYFDLVQRLLARGVPIDGVGHQFHVSLAMPVSALEGALERFSGLRLTQAVTELDVTTGTPESQAKFIEQGYYYRDAFRVFREHADELYSVTVWGLTDGRSWRDSSGGPLLFDDDLSAKPAYYGAADGELPARLRTADVFAGDVPLDDDATSAADWDRLRLHAIDDVAGFQLRWAPDHLTAYVTVADATEQDADAVTFVAGDRTYTFGRDGEGDVDGVVTESEDGWSAVVHLPLAGAAEGDTLDFDVRVTDGSTTTGWNTPGVLGTLSLVEALSFLEVVETGTAPAVDGEVDEAWSAADVVTTDKQVEGTTGATAEVRTLWRGNLLYVLADVADPVVDVTGSDPWIQDSVELYVDAGNFKSNAYRYDDTQIRISADNVVSFGTGDTAFQQARLVSAVVRTDGGYRVEAAISLLDEAGLGTFHGLDFQVNDATAGARTSIRNWADPTGAGYQTPARWGVGQLVAAEEEPEPTPTPTVTPTPEPTEEPTEEPTPTPTVDPTDEPTPTPTVDPTDEPTPTPTGEPTAGPTTAPTTSPTAPADGKPSITLDSAQIRAGGQVQVRLAGFDAGQRVAVSLGAGATARGGAGVGAAAAATAPAGSTLLGTVTVAADGTATLRVTVPARTTAGVYVLQASSDGTVLASTTLTVLAAQAATGGLAVTGTGIGIGVVALLVLAAGVALVAARRRGLLTRS